jgi:hypothetical protein
VRAYKYVLSVVRQLTKAVNAKSGPKVADELGRALCGWLVTRRLWIRFRLARLSLRRPNSLIWI